MEESQRRLPFWDIMINKSGTKIWMDIYNKQTDSKRYVPFTSNHPQQCLTNILFSFARRICIIAFNALKNWKKTLLEQKYPMLLIEAVYLLNCYCLSVQ